MGKRPYEKQLSYPIYKVNAMQFAAGSPTVDDNGKIRAGAMFIDIAKGLGKKKYDWDNKIIVAINIHEMGLFLEGLNGRDLELFHPISEDGKEYKKLAFVRKDGQLYLNLSYKIRGKSDFFGISINPAEAFVLSTLVRKAMTVALNW